ncbi:MAG: ATP-binding cassette domain-containing protein [Leptonema sp. (in: Bacteria)]|nr:ATP-binding cassette domain-containing protein [Leptonema sp. (in: bacteria)]
MKTAFTIQNLSRSFGIRTLFSNLNLSVPANQKIGVIGRNGAGKTTLFKMIEGIDEPDTGSIIFNNSMNFGFLEQHDNWNEAESVLDYLIRKSEEEPWTCSRIAAKMGIEQHQLEEPIVALSGGYRMRVKLASLLARNPDFLFLDEPTNFLDLSTQLFLENFLQSWKGGYMIISHDREFLMQTCEMTLEVSQNELLLFPGNVQEYFAFAEERQEQLAKQQKGIDARRKELMDFVTRFRAKASKATQAQSKLKMAAKLEDVQAIKKSRSARIRIAEVRVSKGPILECEMDIGYPERIVAQNVDLKLGGGERYAVLGDNGQGKSTFLKTIVGAIQPRQGWLRWSPNKRIGYYAQHLSDALRENETVFESLRRMSDSSVNRQQILDMAGGFLFSGDEVDKPIQVLSGGEKSRVCLASLMLQKNDVLLLDEPTNHLDFETVELLALALREYTGTLFFVSHDRTFVNTVASQIIEVRDHNITLYPGLYEDYVFYQRSRVAKELETGVSDVVKKAAETALDPKKQEKRNGNTPLPVAPPGKSDQKKQAIIDFLNLGRKDRQKEMRRLRDQLRSMEKQIQDLEAKRNSLLNTLSNGEYDHDKYKVVDEISKTLTELEHQWVELQNQIELFEGEL